MPAFQQNGFVINPKKTHYADRYSRRIVTGLKVNELVNVDRRYVRNIRATLKSIELLGIAGAEHKFHDRHDGTGRLVNHLRGKISFLTHIKGSSDPVVRSIIVRFNQSFPEYPIKIDPAPEQVRERAVWVVDGDDSQGTAFFLKDVGLVTAAHCVSGVDEIAVLHPSKHANTFKAKVRARDEHRDLAILDHQIPSTEYFELLPLTGHIVTGDPMTALGYPDWAPGDPLNIRPGVVSALTTKRAVKFIEVTQKLTQGMSGGPLLNAAGAVTGIIHKGGPLEGREFAVHISVLEDWLKNG